MAPDVRRRDTGKRSDASKEGVGDIHASDRTGADRLEQEWIEDIVDNAVPIKKKDVLRTNVTGGGRSSGESYQPDLGKGWLPGRRRRTGWRCDGAVICLCDGWSRRLCCIRNEGQERDDIGHARG